ncbi:MAG TPA: phosphate regulon transcriptional regulatory protein PhoB [Rhodobacteraceae bacterium]|nr:phosphate regulon transcriptional regulatory protein PhoB [Paracoccaceae bacterium]
MSIKVLLVEDEEALQGLLEYNLQKEGFEVVIEGDGGAAETAVAEHAPDIILLDWMLPNKNGIDICRALRSKPESKAVPIIMLTARAEEEDKLKGLGYGADDYITKPFSISEVVARIKAVLRRVNPAISEDVVSFADITLDRSQKRVKRAGKTINLGPTEFRLLEVLIQRPGRVYDRAQLLDRVWGQDIYVENRTVDVHVGRLRKALNKGFKTDPIRTVRAAGYALDETYSG